jgi:hypothetical protein
MTIKYIEQKQKELKMNEEMKLLARESAVPLILSDGTILGATVTVDYIHDDDYQAFGEEECELRAGRLIAYNLRYTAQLEGTIIRLEGVSYLLGILECSVAELAEFASSYSESRDEAILDLAEQCMALKHTLNNTKFSLKDSNYKGEVK